MEIHPQITSVYSSSVSQCNAPLLFLIFMFFEYGLMFELIYVLDNFKIVEIGF